MKVVQCVETTLKLGCWVAIDGRRQQLGHNSFNIVNSLSSSFTIQHNTMDDVVKQFCSISSIHRQFFNSKPGLLIEEKRRIRATIDGFKSASKRLLFLNVNQINQDCDGDEDDDELFENRCNIILKRNIGFFNESDIEKLLNSIAKDGDDDNNNNSLVDDQIEIDVVGFVERDLFASSKAPCNLHAMALILRRSRKNTSDDNDDGGELLLRIVPDPMPEARDPRAAKSLGQRQTRPAKAPRKFRANGVKLFTGASNSDRASIFAQFIVETFGAHLRVTNDGGGGGVLDVAGGAGALSLELVLRRGVSSVCVDPRPMSARDWYSHLQRFRTARLYAHQIAWADLLLDDLNNNDCFQLNHDGSIDGGDRFV
jgi:hypothetical protein